MNALRSSSSVLFLFLFLLLVVPLSGACRAPEERVSASSPGCHPACPGAKEGALPAASTVLRSDAPQLAPVDEHARSSAAYLCPMHPWIGSDQPGHCSVCNMQLVERAKVPERKHGS